MSLNREVCTKVMGWHVVAHLDPKDDCWNWADENNHYARPSSFNPIDDLNDAHEVEEKIKEMGLGNQYVIALTDILNYRENIPNDFALSPTFTSLHASAYDRCRAALMAVEGKR